MDFLRFTPSRVEGLLPSGEVVPLDSYIWEVIIKPDRFELLSLLGSMPKAKWIPVRFNSIAQWPEPRLQWKLKSMVGIRPNWFPVGEKHWSNSPADRFFRFFALSGKPFIIYMPIDEPQEYEKSNFRTIQQIISIGGYSTLDIG